MNNAVAIIGAGRMGRVLATKLFNIMQVIVYDQDTKLLNKVAKELDLTPVSNLAEISNIQNVILAVPDREVIGLIKDFNLMRQKVYIYSIATNVEQHVLDITATGKVKCIGVKFIGHAGEMAQGAEPVIIINEQPAELIAEAQKLFACIGKVLVGKADIVRRVNTIAAEAVLYAAVQIEEKLAVLGLNNDEAVKSALEQVAAGTLKAYANGDLGPFARELVQAVRFNLKR